MTRYLVTGGFGFIGSSLVRLLARRAPRDKLMVLDKMTYAADQRNLDGIAYQCVHGDLCEPRAVRRCRADVIFHLAAETHVDRSITNAAPFTSTNVVGTQVLLDAAVDWGTRLFIHVSTDEVFGAGGPFRESDRLQPRNPYAASKAGAEHLVQAYAITHTLPVLITRCCNNYGPRQHPEKLIPKAIQHLLQGEPVPLYGDGKQQREWLHVQDHCEALWFLSQRGQAGEAYHITTGQSLSNIAMVQKLASLLGGGSYKLVEDRPGHDRSYALSGDKLAALGWKPTVSLDEGLTATVAYYRERFQVPASMPTIS
jgi:dTDP-glucose 4,6-dehydratase